MRRWSNLLIPGICLTVTSFAVAAAVPPTDLTPKTMVEAGFSFEFRWTDITSTKGTKGNEPPRRTGAMVVRVTFDVAKGPRIKEMNDASLLIRDGDEVVLAVPIDWKRNDPPDFIEFVIHERMLANASIVLTNHTERDAPSYAIPLQMFRTGP